MEEIVVGNHSNYGREATPILGMSGHGDPDLQWCEKRVGDRSNGRNRGWKPLQQCKRRHARNRGWKPIKLWERRHARNRG